MKIAPKFNEEIGKQKSLLEERHLSGAGGFEICRQWSNFTDGLISELLNKTIGKSDKSGFTIAALGGYGRGELNPHSDIDLLFLFEKEVSVKSNTAPTRIIPSLWDLGFKVGHSARTVTDCIRIAREDAISRTSMIEARFLMGNRELFDYLERMLKKKVIMKKLSHFLRSKRLEMELRHEKYNKTLFLTEPNVKESPGGLRDYQTAIWVAIGRYGVRNIEGLEKRGLLSLNEKEEVFSAVDFLLKIRNDLHFLESAPNDVLAYGLQPRIAKRLGYRGDDEETVPALMNDYFRAADTVFHFAMSIVDQAIRHRSRARMLLLKLRHRQIAPNIFAGHEEIYIKDISPEDIASSPEKVFQILEVAAEYELKISPVLRKTLGAVGKIWKKQKPDSKRLADGFRSLLQRDDSSEQLRIMRDVKILTSIIPEFHAIRYHTPFDLYHRYTVDDHTFIAMSEFDNLKRNDRTECDVLRSLYESAESPSTSCFDRAFLHSRLRQRARRPPQQHRL